MSRRRRPKPLSRPQVKVVCTDRGQHTRVRIQRLTDYRANPSELTEQDIAQHHEVCTELGLPAPDGFTPYRAAGILYSGPGTFWTAASGRRLRPSWPAVGRDRPDGGTTYVFPCHACGRAPQLRAEHLAAALDRLYATAPDEADRRAWTLDVSYAD